MAENTVGEKIAPPLVKDEADNLNKESESEPEAALETAVAGVKSKYVLGFVCQRSTYYWIAFIAQFAQLVLLTIGVAVTRSRPMVEDNEASLFITARRYSLFTSFFVWCLVVVSAKSKSNLKRPVKAGHHARVAAYCAFFNIVNIISMIKLAMNFDKYTDNVLPVVIPLIFGFMFVSALACTTAACITRTVAKRARGSDMVPDPERRVPAWRLATTEESQGLSRQNAVQSPC